VVITGGATCLRARLVRLLRADYGLTVNDETAEVEFARTLVEWWRAAAG